MRHILKQLRSLVSRYGLPEAATLASLLVVVLGIWAFAVISGEMREGETQAFDVWVVRSLRQPGNPAQPIGPGWLPEVARDITALGGISLLTMMTAIVVGFLCLRRKYHAVGFLLVSLVGGALLCAGFKAFYDRPRPSVVPHLASFDSASFPSGHSMLSAVMYLTMGVMLARLSGDRASKVYFLSAAVVLAFVVGLSRVYLGVHYPTDVLAGWAAGITWAILCSLATRHLQGVGAMEKPSGRPAIGDGSGAGAGEQVRAEVGRD